MGREPFIQDIKADRAGLIEVRCIKKVMRDEEKRKRDLRPKRGGSDN